MKKNTALFFALLFAFLFVTTASAQTQESIWLTTDTTSYKTQDTVFVRVNAASATPIQGFTFQIRYDPKCLKPINAVSPISGMNGLQLPQEAGLVDASFASATPQSAMGILAEVTFQTLGGCQTDVYLESAALAVRNESGFAVPVEGIALLERNISLSIDSAVGNGVPQPTLPGSPLSLEPEAQSAGSQSFDWAAVIAVSLLFFVAFSALVVILFFYKKSVKV